MLFDVLAGSSILVVGGAGFVGSNLCYKILEYKPQKLIIIDNLLSADSSNLPDSKNLIFHTGSITDDSMLNKIPTNIDFVFHLATYHGNQCSIANPLEDHENNTLTTLKLFEHIKSFKNLKKVVYASSGCTTAEKTNDEPTAVVEDAPISLYHDSPYQISKIIGEFYGNYYYMRYGLPFVKARFQNVYGPREILGAGKWRGTPATVWRNVVPTFIYKSLAKQALQLDNGGLNTRDFIFVDDIVDGLMRCAVLGNAGEVYNLASGVETTIKDLADTINVITKNPTPSEVGESRDWDRSGRRYGNTNKANEHLKFRALIPLSEGLGHTVTWTRKNIDIIQRCMNQHAKNVEIPSIT